MPPSDARDARDIDRLFTGQRALITGGTKGIGLATAHRLGRLGASLTLTYGGDHQAAQTALHELKAAGVQADVRPADSADETVLQSLIDDLHATGPLDMLILNAAYQEKRTFDQTTLETMDRTLAVNVRGNFLLAHAVSQRMVRDGVRGRIVVSGSPHAHQPFPDAFAYDVSKAALHHMARCMALPLARHGVRVNVVEIGWTITPGERRFSTEQEQRELSARAIPCGRSAEPDEIAAVIEFLCRPESSYIAGSIVPADGGFMLQPCPDA